VFVENCYKHLKKPKRWNGPYGQLKPSKVSICSLFYFVARFYPSLCYGYVKLHTMAVLDIIRNKWSLGAVWFIAAGAYPSFCSMKRVGVSLLPLDRMLIHRRSLTRNLLGFPNKFAGTHLYSWGERVTVLPKDTTQCPWPGLEPGPLDRETSVLTMRPSHRASIVLDIERSNSQGRKCNTTPQT